MEEIIAEVKKVGREYRMGDKEIKVICYTDDAVMTSESKDDLSTSVLQQGYNTVSYRS